MFPEQVDRDNSNSDTQNIRGKLSLTGMCAPWRKIAWSNRRITNF